MFVASSSPLRVLQHRLFRSKQTPHRPEGSRFDVAARVSNFETPCCGRSCQQVPLVAQWNGTPPPTHLERGNGKFKLGLPNYGQEKGKVHRSCKCSKNLFVFGRACRPDLV